MHLMLHDFVTTRISIGCSFRPLLFTCCVQASTVTTLPSIAIQPAFLSVPIEGLSEPECYGDLVYKFKKLKGRNYFYFQFRKIITRYRRIGYNLNVKQQSACLVFNPIMVDNYAAFFNCTPVGRASDLMMAPT